ncbi:MAG: lipoprotein [Gammaproteobacteria bacterium]
MYLRYLKLLPLLLCLSACGQTGSLYLPEKTAPPVKNTLPPPQDEQAPEPPE